MPTLSLSTTIGGQAITGALSRAGSPGEANLGQSVTLPAAKAGTLTTRTDNDTGTITLSTGHGLVDGDIVDVYWVNTGGTRGHRRGMAVSSSASTTVVVGAVTVGSGDNLPTASSAVTIVKQVVLDLDFTAASAILSAVSHSRFGQVEFQESGGTAVKSLFLGKNGGVGEAWAWASNTDASTPFGSNVGKIVASNGDSANAATLKVGVTLNNAS